MDFTKFESFILREFNLDLSGYKSAQLHRRILTIMSRAGAKDLDEYDINKKR